MVNKKIVQKEVDSLREGQRLAEKQKLTTEEEAQILESQRLAAEKEAQRRAAEEEAQRRAAEEEAQRRAAEEEAQRRAAEEEAKRKSSVEHSMDGTQGEVFSPERTHHIHFNSNVSNNESIRNNAFYLPFKRDSIWILSDKKPIDKDGKDRSKYILFEINKEKNNS